MIYRTYISTKVNGEDLRFTVQYSGESRKEVLELANKEWPFPEYYCKAALPIEFITCPFTGMDITK